MIVVPEGKVLYVGSRKFVAGEVIPPHLRIEDIQFKKRDKKSLSRKKKKK
jgi:hypothetical protein